MEPIDDAEPLLPSVSELPLFPLDLVLFPHMLAPLHIFEERYKEMVNRCVRESLPFGIVLITNGSDVNPDSQTCRIGCTARIRRVERLPDGCINIEVVGEQRFRILETHEVLPYRTGITEPLHDDPLSSDGPNPLSEDVQRLLKEFLTRQLALLGQHDVEIELPEEPDLLSFTAACVLPMENDAKQALLEGTDVNARLAAELDVLRRELTRLRRAAESVEVSYRPVRTEHYRDYVCEN
ncbi:MAG TPA: LON peptidase substrate-binding domain-containing protein [Armatimonadaceae bacterium]|nr:LON peptidase substrate-binding domain-containing protein [Armatimonadaceae bacterium]